MTIYLSDLMKNGALVQRGAYAGEDNVITGSMTIPAGTVLADNSELKFMRLPEGAFISRILITSPDLDASTGLAARVGYVRPTVNPGLAYDATTNPYTDNAIATADDDFFETDVTAPFQASGHLDLAWGGFTVTTQANTGLAGDADVTITVTTVATTATAADGVLKVTAWVRFNDEGTPATESYNYSTDYDIT